MSSPSICRRSDNVKKIFRCWLNSSCANTRRKISASRGALPLIEARADASLFDVMEECERQIIIDMLEKCNWNQTEAAERFHIPLSTLNQKIKRLSIEIKKKTRE